MGVTKTRIEIDSDLKKRLDNIKDKHHIWGRGHSKTVRYLASYYEQHKPLLELKNEINGRIADFLRDLNGNIETALTKAMLTATQKTFATIFKMAESTNQPVPGSRAAPGCTKRDDK